MERQRAADMIMYPTEARHGRLRQFPIGAGRYRDEAGGPTQAAMHVHPKIGMVPDVTQKGRVQHLHEQAADPADHHARQVAMHPPSYPGFPLATVVEHMDHLMADGLFDAVGQGAGCQHVGINEWSGRSLRMNCQSPAATPIPLFLRCYAAGIAAHVTCATAAYALFSHRTRYAPRLHQRIPSIVRDVARIALAV